MACKYDIKVDKYDSYGLTITCYQDESNTVLVDLTGYDAIMQVRKNYNSSSVITEASTNNGKISINVIAGTITISFSYLETDDFPVMTGYYDLVITSTGYRRKIMEGLFEVTESITHD